MNNKTGAGGQKPKTTNIITYSPSKFLNRVGSTQTHTLTKTTISATTTTAASSPSSYYVVKAGSMGSAASMAGTIKVNASPSPPKAVAMTVTPTPTESSSTISAPSESSLGDKMEHSYMRDPPSRSSQELHNSGLAPARTILVQHPPQCPTCHTYPPHQEESSESQQAHVPSYDEISAKEAMNECARIAKYVKNPNPDEQDWQERINQFGWSPLQLKLFQQVAEILDKDQLARLANDKRQHEAVYRRVTVDKSASRMRRALASVAWDSRTTQWLHTLLMEHLSPSYMASYLDIMQTLKTKLPTLTDKMLFSRPLSNCQELLAPVMKKKWEPQILPKSRQFAHNAIMVALPTMPTSGPVPERMQKWYKSLASITQIVQITLPNTNDRIAHQNLDQVAETIVSLTRVRIHELRTENPSRGIILIGFNAGAALALQVALSESVACVVCLGFAYNTLRGPRGSPDDRMLDIKAPILFVIGQNSARTSQEEMEGLRERMQSESSLVVVGSADDSLRVPKSKRRIEGVTQAMVDAMVVDEIFDFVNKTLSNPPGPRMPSSLLPTAYQRQQKLQQAHVLMDKSQQFGRKRKGDGSDETGLAVKTKFMSHNDTLDYDETTQLSSVSKLVNPKPGPQPVNLAAGTKIKMIPSSQFVQLKPLSGGQNKLINYGLNKPAIGANANIGSIVKTGPGPATSSATQQIITIKAPVGQSSAFAPGQQKYTVIKNSNGMTMLQLTKSVTTTTAPGAVPDLSNIIDMPIVFADNEGNIAEQTEQQQSSAAPVRNKSPLIISQKIIKEATHPPPGKSIVINKSLQQLFTTTQSGASPSTTSKVVYLNRSTMKPMSNVVTSARLPIRIVGSPKQATTSTSASGAATGGSPLLLDAKSVSLQPLKTSPGGTLRHVATKTYPQFQVINNPTTTVAGQETKAPIRNIYFKSATGLKQVPVQMLASRVSTGINTGVIPTSTPGGAAVRRVVNLASMPKDGKVIKLQTSTAVGASTSTVTQTKK